MWSETFCSWTLPVPPSAPAPFLWLATENSDFSPWKASDCARHHMKGLPPTGWTWGTVNVTLLTLHVVEDLMILRMTRCAGRPGPRRTAKRLFHSTGGLSGDREQRFLGSWVQWLLHAPGRQICSLVVKHGLQLSNKRHTGELLGKLWVCREWFGNWPGQLVEIIWARPLRTPILVSSLPKVAVWPEISHLPSLTLFLISGGDPMHFTESLWPRPSWENRNESAL